MEQQVTILLQTIEDQKATIATLSEKYKKEVEGLNARIKELMAQVAYLNRQLFGRKAERLPDYNPAQLNLFAEQFAEDQKVAEQKCDEAVAKIVKEAPAGRKRKRQNRKMMEDLPVLKETVIDVEDIDLTVYRKIGEEVTKKLRHQPGKLYVEKVIRIKYGLIDNTNIPADGSKGVRIAPMPLMPIYKCMADADVLAEILLQKYEYHIPFYRQIQQFAHLGLKGLQPNTLNDWFKGSVELLRPLYGALKKETMNCDYCQADETTVPVINHQKQKAAKEYLWMVRSVMRRLVFFHYDNGSRAGTVIEALAKEYNFKGYLQCDGFKGYETAFKGNANVTLVNCMAHIRRYFERALDENRAGAEKMLANIQSLYKLERLCDEKELSADERMEKRQEMAKPIMDAMKTWMEVDGMKYSPSSLIGKAVTYAYTRWDNMMRYLEDGRLRIDNNLAENAIRPVTLGRKNYLFCGNHEAADNMAVICSLLATCKAQDVNPRDYLISALSDMPYHKNATHEQLVELLPHKWKERHTQSEQ